MEILIALFRRAEIHGANGATARLETKPVDAVMGGHRARSRMTIRSRRTWSAGASSSPSRSPSTRSAM